MKNNTLNKFAVGDLVVEKGYEEVGFIVEVRPFPLVKSYTHRYRVHWFQTDHNSFWYNEDTLIPK